MKAYRLDVKKAIDQFCSNIEKLSHLPLITEDETALVYGSEVAEALTDLDLFNREERVCLKCKDKCCRLVHCELFHRGFTQCPVYDYRPALCRMHFCREFDARENSLVKDLGVIFLDSLIEAGRQGSRKVLLFDSPPLGRLIPGLIKTILRYIEAVKAGKLDEADARKLINDEVKFSFRLCEPK